MKCKYCDKEMNSNSDYCPFCGKKQIREKKCTCGKILKADFHFCPFCGKKIQSKTEKLNLQAEKTKLNEIKKNAKNTSSKTIKSSSEKKSKTEKSSIILSEEQQKKLNKIYKQKEKNDKHNLQRYMETGYDGFLGFIDLKDGNAQAVAEYYDISLQEAKNLIKKQRELNSLYSW